MTDASTPTVRYWRQTHPSADHAAVHSMLRAAKAEVLREVAARWRGWPDEIHATHESVADWLVAIADDIDSAPYRDDSAESEGAR